MSCFEKDILIHFNALWHFCAVNNPNLPVSGPSAKRLSFPAFQWDPQHDRRGFVPTGQTLPEETVFQTHSCWLTILDHTTFGSPWSPSIQFSPPFPSPFFPLPVPKNRQLGQIYSGLPGLLLGRAESFQWVLVRARRLVTRYLQRGHRAWALWSRKTLGLCGDFVVPCCPRAKPQSLLTPSSPRTWFYSKSWFPIPCSASLCLWP